MITEAQLVSALTNPELWQIAREVRLYQETRPGMAGATRDAVKAMVDRQLNANPVCLYDGDEPLGVVMNPKLGHSGEVVGDLYLLAALLPAIGARQIYCQPVFSESGREIVRFEVGRPNPEGVKFNPRMADRYEAHGDGPRQPASKAEVSSAMAICNVSPGTSFETALAKVRGVR